MTVKVGSSLLRYSTDLFLQKGLVFIIKQIKEIKHKLTNVKGNHFSFFISFDQKVCSTDQGPTSGKKDPLFLPEKDIVHQDFHQGTHYIFYSSKNLNKIFTALYFMDAQFRRKSQQQFYPWFGDQRLINRVPMECFTNTYSVDRQ